jgi:hypothetical protein
MLQSAIGGCDGPHVLGRTGRVTLGSGVPVEVALNWQAVTQPKIARSHHQARPLRLVTVT